MFEWKHIFIQIIWTESYIIMSINQLRCLWRLLFKNWILKMYIFFKTSLCQQLPEITFPSSRERFPLENMKNQCNKLMKWSSKTRLFLSITYRSETYDECLVWEKKKHHVSQGSTAPPPLAVTNYPDLTWVGKRWCTHRYEWGKKGVGQLWGYLRQQKQPGC